VTVWMSHGDGSRDSAFPLLGICYGMQAMGYLMGGHVVPATRGIVSGKHAATPVRASLSSGRHPHLHGVGRTKLTMDGG
jgi:GMP synthase-like glutamine amidotransferase